MYWLSRISTEKFSGAQARSQGVEMNSTPRRSSALLLNVWLIKKGRNFYCIFIIQDMKEAMQTSRIPEHEIIKPEKCVISFGRDYSDNIRRFK